MIEKYPEIETIGLSLPGSIEHGVVYLEDHPIHQMNVGEILKQRYHRDVMPFNDANMIVTGIYWLEDRYKSVVLYFLPNDTFRAGCGVVVNGHLIRGRQNVAGEVGYIEKIIQFSKDPEKLIETEEGTAELVGKSLVSLISSLGPEAIFVYANKITDGNEIKEEIEKNNSKRIYSGYCISK